MKQLTMEGERAFILGPSQVTLKVGRIANYRSSGVSESLRIRLYALESSSADNLRGHIVGEIELHSLPAGSEKLGFEATVPLQPIPNGYFYPALTLAERNSISPNGWAIFDICRFDDPVFFGKRLILNDATFSISKEFVRVNISKIRNETQETTGALRVTFLLTKEPYVGGPVKGLKIGEATIEPLDSGQIQERLEWKFNRPGDTSKNTFGLLFLEEKVDEGWLTRDHFGAAIDNLPEGQEHTSVTDSGGDPMSELDAMIGLHTVKREMRDLEHWAAWVEKLRKHGRETKKLRTLHMCFTGNPGTGKTTVARIAGRLLAKHGLLQRDSLKEVTRSDLIAGYVGQTAKQTDEIIKEALGGVLFIDEAYSLSEARAFGGGQDYGPEAITTLISAMENHRDKLCVIFAGYTAEMERFLDVNPGMKSRIARTIEFPDYSEDEMWEIFERMVAREELTCDSAVEPEFKAYMRRLQFLSKPGQFGNARSVRNTLERATQALASRVQSLANPSLDELTSLKLSEFGFFFENGSLEKNKQGATALGKPSSRQGAAQK